MMKKLLNNPDDIMLETIKGYVKTNRGRLKLNPGTHEVVRRQPKEKGKVKLVIGNGGGHEPNQLGLVGYGMYDMNCLGEIFTAQSGEVFYEGIQHLDDGSPVFIVIANHAGDVINGNIAYAMALDDGMEVERGIFYDDVGSAPKGEESERRGMAGLLFAVKMTGAAAESGANLEECKRIFDKVRDNTRTFGFSLSGCTHPITGLEMSPVPDDVVSMGGGIHGEGGVNTIPFGKSKEICKAVCDILIEDKPFKEGDEVIVLVNGNGGTTLMELSIFSNDVEQYLESKHIKVYDMLAMNLITVQEQCGASVSIIKVDDELKELWDDPCSTPSYSNR